MPYAKTMKDALRVVERYYGAAVASDTAFNMEYRRTQRPQSVGEV